MIARPYTPILPSLFILRPRSGWNAAVSGPFVRFPRRGCLLFRATKVPRGAVVESRGFGCVTTPREKKGGLDGRVSVGAQFPTVFACEPAGITDGEICHPDTKAVADIRGQRISREY